MAAKAVSMQGRRTCTVEVSPREVDAGGELTVAVRVSCADGLDLRGQSVSIQSKDGAVLATAELTEFDGEICAACAFVLRAPLEVGEHTCRAVLAAHEKDGVFHEETSTEFSFTAKPHVTSVNVWALPSAIAAGERFRFKVGIKCSAGCRLTGMPLILFDDEGTQVGAASLRDDIWPGTSALYFAEVDAQAPLRTGDHEWRADCPELEQDVPHAAGAFTFTVKVVSPPDHEVTVEAFDAETQTPIMGAHVLLHPYRALTDERGVAQVRVAKGRYKLFVSGFRYVAYEGFLDVAGDVVTRAELTSEPEGQEDYR
jgi:hypothetical protein